MPAAGDEAAFAGAEMGETGRGSCPAALRKAASRSCTPGASAGLPAPRSLARRTVPAESHGAPGDSAPLA